MKTTVDLTGNRSAYSRYIQLLFITVLLVIVIFVPPGQGYAATAIQVNSSADAINTDGKCTLREAIIAANKDAATSDNKPGECIAGPGTDTINLPPGTYTLTRTDNGKEDSSSTGDLDVTSSITIIATGPVTITGGNGFSDRIFHVLSGSLTLSNVTLQNGNVSGDGGAIYNKGTLTLRNSTLSGNKAGGNGGGLYNAGTMTLANVTLSGNSSKNSGGGLYNHSNTATLNNLTISANIADSDANNSGNGGGLARERGTVNLKNTLIAGNLDKSTTADKHLDCSGTLASQGYNLIGTIPGCTLSGTTTGNQIGDPKLGPLQNNGGPTLTYALLDTSPAIDKGNPATPGSGGNACEATDQRGISRPRRLACDIGAFEANDLAQTGPVFTVTTSSDAPDDNICGVSHCSLREAITAANARQNDSGGIDEIRFKIELGGGVITPASALPEITNPALITGSGVELHGPFAPAGGVPINCPNLNDPTGLTNLFDGLKISSGNSEITGLVITGFGGHGIRLLTNGQNNIHGNIAINSNCGDGVHIASGSGNKIQQNYAINYNNGAGVRVLAGVDNTIQGNTISGNKQLGIDLGGDGPTENDRDDLDDPDNGANHLQNGPVVTLAVPDRDNINKTILEGRVNSTSGTTFTLEFFANTSCDSSGFGQGQQILGSTTVTTNDNGNINFSDLPFDLNNPIGQFVTATATDAQGNTSEFSACTRIDIDNFSWPRALDFGAGITTVSQDQSLDKLGQSRWYKFKVDPNSRVTVTLTGLPANYDLTIYKDIGAAFEADLAALNEPQDLVELNAEFAPDALAIDSFAAGSRSPDNFAAGSRSPDEFAPDAFAAEVFAAGSRSPDAFAAGSRSPDAFAAGSRSPDVYSPDAFAMDSFAAGSRSPDDLAAGSRSPEFFYAYASAQTRSLIGVSAFEGTTGEGIIVNTWNNEGDFYVRVRGRDGAFVPAAQFHLEVTLESKICGAFIDEINQEPLPATTLSINDNAETLILTDLSRMPDTPSQALDAFAGQVGGVVINVADDDRVRAANSLADRYPACPYAKNLVADAIRRVVNNYRDNHNLNYVVIVGNDNVIPFFRYQDNSLLGPESDYVPPVKDSTASQASLKLNYVLSQDAYGSKTDISLKMNQFPIPDLPVGRLVETPEDIISLLKAYAETGSGQGNGVTPADSALVTGYDFFADAAGAINDELLEGGLNVNTLISGSDVSPQDPSAWTATQLRDQLLSSRHDLVFLGGHFSAASALAADYQTRMVTADLLASSVDLKNALIYSIGCHSGYNVVNPHAILGVTREPDWAQAFAQKGATLVAGTGYQYGDTDYIEYSERIYLEFTKQLRTGASVGQALVTAKQIYLAQTPEIRGLHEKSLLEATIFGLPMLKPQLPNTTSNPGSDSIIDSVNSFVAPSPGSALGLQYADIHLAPSLSEEEVTLTNLDSDDNSLITASYLRGGDNIVTHPLEPVLPLEMPDVSAPQPDLVLRGVGFRGGSYTDQLDILPLTGAPATEIRGVHSTFSSEVFYPIRPWSINYFDVLANGGDGVTRLAVTPAQHKSDDPAAPTNTRRRFDGMDFRLYYSNNVAPVTSTEGGDLSIPALAAAPEIVGITAIINPDSTITFKATVVGNPTAGVQEVWITSTVCPTAGSCNGLWESHNLEQNPNNPTVWEKTISLADLRAAQPQDIRYIIQAANGVGLVNLLTNMGAFYIPGVGTTNRVPTTLTLSSIPTSGRYGTSATFSAILTTNGSPLPGRLVTFALGGQNMQGITNSAGQVTATLPQLLQVPGFYRVTASFAGTVDFAPASAASDPQKFEIQKQETQLALDNASASGRARDERLVVATLKDATGRPLAERSVVFVLQKDNQVRFSVSEITDYLGRAALGNIAVDNIPLPPGLYNLTVYFNGTIPLSTGDSVTLTDDRYHATNVSGTLELTNQKPVAVDDSGYSVDEDTILVVTSTVTATQVFSGVLANDSDGDGDVISATLVSAPPNGSVILDASGAFTYTPNINFNGLDTFTYQATDGFEPSNTATVSITVNPVPDPPTLADDTYSVDEDNTLTVAAPGVLNNDVDPDGEVLTATLHTLPYTGTLIFESTGAFTYTPPPDFNGPVTFTYTDGQVQAAQPATVTITVNPVNDPPVAVDDLVSTNEDTALSIAVLANDEDIDGDTLTVAGVTQGANGVVTNNGTDITYTPNPNFFGTDTFTYQASDAIANSNIATVTVTITPVNDPPVAVDDAYATDEDTPLTVAAPGVLGNDSDPVEQDAITAVLAPNGAPANGTLALNPDGSFTYTPNPDFFGTDTFTYQAADVAPSNPVTVTITVNPINDAPVAVDDSGYSTPENTALTIPAPGVLTNDTDADGDSLTASLVGSPANGGVTLNADGSFTYTPNPDFSGDDSFTYKANDGTADSNTATVSITVTPVNQPPDCSEAEPSQNTIWPPNKDFVAVDIFNVTDPDGNSINITITSIFQDEPVGNEVDGQGIGTSTALVRAERDGNGDGRVYHISFTGDDGQGGVCSGEVVTGIVPHDQSGDLPDGGAIYDSTIPE